MERLPATSYTRYPALTRLEDAYGTIRAECERILEARLHVPDIECSAATTPPGACTP